MPANIKELLKNTQEIFMTDSAVGTLLDFERVLDELDLYAFDHWKMMIPAIGMQQMSGMGYNSKMENVLERVLETQNAILTKLNAEELEEEDEEPKNSIGSLLMQPHIQTLLIAGVSKLLGIGGMEAQPAGMAGIEDVNENEAIIIFV